MKVVRVFDGYSQTNIEKFSGFSSMGFTIKDGKISSITDGGFVSYGVCNSVGGGEVLNVDDYSLEDDIKVFIVLIEHDIKKDAVDISLRCGSNINDDDIEIIKNKYLGKISKAIKFEKLGLEEWVKHEDYISMLLAESEHVDFVWINKLFKVDISYKMVEKFTKDYHQTYLTLPKVNLSTNVICF